MDAVDEYQRMIRRVFKKHAIKKGRSSFKDICFPKQFTYQPPQLFVRDFMRPDTKSRGLLIYHKIGAGKTCAAVQIAMEWHKRRNVIFVCPASLVGNVYKEFRSECAGVEYVRKEERELLKSLDPFGPEYGRLVEEINGRIDEHYTIYSYNKFVELIDKKDRKLKEAMKNALLIIDEVHNIVSDSGSTYSKILNLIESAPPSLRVVIMTATPIFDKPYELGLTMNLLRPKERFPEDSEFTRTFIEKTDDGYQLINKDKLMGLLNGLVSYYRGAPDLVFPKREQKVLRCRMSRYQYSCYRTVEENDRIVKNIDITKLPTNFLIGNRVISNIAFPNKLVNKRGFDALTKSHMTANLDTYSAKFARLLKKLKSAGTAFVYSSFKEYGGIRTIAKILEANGYKNFMEAGPGKKRYAVWSGDEAHATKERVREVFNSPDNTDGHLIKVLLGSPSIKEGVSLLRVRNVHVMEPYWNMSRIEQVIGRAIRFCSHKDMPKEDRRVKVYMYVASAPEGEKEANGSPVVTVDEHILAMALLKQDIVQQFEAALKEAAVDRLLFQ